MVGWGTLMHRIVRGPFRRGDTTLATPMLVSVLAWFAVDSTGSLAADLPGNVALNVAFLGLFVPPLVGLRLDGRRNGRPHRRTVPAPGVRSSRRRSWALAATTIVDADMRTAPTAGGRSTPAQAKAPGGEGDGGDVVPGRPPEVLERRAVGGPCEPDDGRPPPRGRKPARTGPADLDGDVGPGADGDADVGTGERRGVVDAVADHRHLEPRSCSSTTLASLSSGRTSAKTSSTPSRVADGSGDLAASPVIITTRVPTP
jgi:hypothetical protein